MKRLFVTFLFLALSFASVSLAEDTLLARIGDRKITMDDFKRIVSYYDAEKQKLLDQYPQYRATILLRIVQDMVISTIAKGKEFEKMPEMKEQIDLLVNDFLATEYVKKEVIGKIEVTEDDMKLYYKGHEDEFKTPEMVRAQQILVKIPKASSPEEKQKMREKIEGALKRIKDGEDFEKVASEVSDDAASKTKGGDLGFFPRGKMAPDFEKAAFTLKPGEVSDVIETPSGFYIIKVEEKKEAGIESYERVKDKVKEKVFAEFKKAQVDEFVEKAMKDAGVEMNLKPLLTKK